MKKKEKENVVSKQNSIFGVVLVFILLSLLSIFIWQQLEQIAQDELEVVFEVSSAETIAQVGTHLEEYTNILYSLRALYSASASVERDEWSRYVNALEIDKRLPGIQAIEFIRVVDGGEVDAFMEDVRLDTSLVQEGYPDFAISPVSDEETYYVVDYIEPLLGNGAAFGFNLGSNSERLEALEEARDTNSTIVTSPITLVQETDMQAGFLMVLPIYRNGLAIDSLNERREALDGYVLIVFRAGDLFKSSLEFIPSFTDLHLTVIDAEVGLGESGRLFDTQEFENTYSSSFSLERNVDISGREWTFIFHDAEGFVSSRDKDSMTIVVLIAGIIISALVSVLFYSYSVTRSKAVLLAKKMTREYEKAKIVSEKSKQDALVALREAEIVNEKLEKMNSSMTGRELKMVALKEEIETFKRSNVEDSRL